MQFSFLKLSVVQFSIVQFSCSECNSESNNTLCAYHSKGSGNVRNSFEIQIEKLFYGRVYSHGEGIKYRIES